MSPVIWHDLLTSWLVVGSIVKMSFFFGFFFCLPYHVVSLLTFGGYSVGRLVAKVPRGAG